jgi:hypothetical protein
VSSVIAVLKIMDTRSWSMMLCAMLMLSICVGVSAQEASEALDLIYIRDKQESGYELVSLSSAGRHAFHIAPEDCWTRSPSKRFIVIQEANAVAISVFQRATGQIRHIPIDAGQASCNVSWYEDEKVVAFLDSSEGQAPEITFAINIFNGEVVSVDRPTPTPPLMIPDYVPDDFMLFSPNRSLVVYNRCEGGEYSTGFDGDYFCTSIENLVIYSLTSGEIVATLENTNQDWLVGPGGSNVDHLWWGIEWSPSSRYLVYRTAPSEIRLRIFDVDERRDLAVRYPQDADFNRIRGFRWLRGEAKVAFWLNSFTELGERLALLSTETGAITISSNRFYPAFTGWAASDDTVVFVDADRNLVMQNLETEDSAILDTAVWNIL